MEKEVSREETPVDEGHSERFSTPAWDAPEDTRVIPTSTPKENGRGMAPRIEELVESGEDDIVEVDRSGNEISRERNRILREIVIEGGSVPKKKPAVERVRKHR